MSVRSERYEEAAEKYQKVKNLNSFKKETDDISGFIVGQEWGPALKLLEASGKEIQIGYEDGAHSDVGYFLSLNGFILKYNKDGKEVVEQLIASSVDATEEIVLQIARAFRKRLPESIHGQFEEIIFEALDMIADTCPK